MLRGARCSASSVLGTHVRIGSTPVRADAVKQDAGRLFGGGIGLVMGAQPARAGPFATTQTDLCSGRPATAQARWARISILACAPWI